MLTSPIFPPATTCRSCGAHGGSSCSSTCKPDRGRFPVGRMRGVGRDARLSAAVRASDAVDRALLRQV
jgi:hypothetical protein